MLYKGSEPAQPIETRAHKTWIIGYGNPQRRDDGIGPCVIHRLRERLKGREEIGTHTSHQLEPELIYDLRQARMIIFVDATLSALENGWYWTRIYPRLDALPYANHHLEPSFILGLFRLVYHRSPRAWMVSIQGDDFGIGEGLSPQAENRVHQAVSDIVRFMSIKGGDRRQGTIRPS